MNYNLRKLKLLNVTNYMFNLGVKSDANQRNLLGD
jgi:hypothetical protein